MRSKKLESLQTIIRKFLVLQQVIFLFVILLIILLAIYWGGQRQIESQHYADDLLSGRMGDYFDMAVRGLGTLAAMPPTNESLVIVGKTNAYFDVLYFIDPSGRLEGIYPPDPQFPVGRDMTTTPYFNVDHSKHAVSRPFISPRTGNPTIYLSLPAANKNGIVVGELSLAGLEENLVRSNISPLGIFYITDQDGYLLAHPNYELVRQQVDIRQSGIIDRAKSGQLTQLYIANGIPVLGVVAQNQETGYWAIVEASIYDLYSPFLIPVILGLLLTLLLFALIVWREQINLAHRIVNPLIELKNDAQRLSDGDFSFKGTPTAKGDSYEEVFSLAMYFDRMKQAVQSRESALAQEKNLLRTIIDNVPDSIFAKDLQGRKTLSNPADVNNCRKTSENEVLGKTDDELFPPELAAHFKTDDEAVLKNGEVVLNREEYVVNQTGGPVYLNTSKLPLRDSEGRIIGLVGIGHNITDSKRAEDEIRKLNMELEQRVQERTAELAEANREMEAFSYSVSHDLRTPLRTIDGFSKVILEDYIQQLDPTAQNYFNRIRTASQRMGNLIDDLLKLSHLSRTQFILEDVDLTIQARDILAAFQTVEPQRQVEIILPDKLVVRADAHLMSIALDNLLRNAWKFTGKCEKARIEFGSFIKDGRHIFFVKDNGAGFDMAHVGKLFSAFQRLHPITEYDGTGIGLAIVQRIITRHGGTVWAEGAINQGAVFYFSLA